MRLALCLSFALVLILREITTSTTNNTIIGYAALLLLCGSVTLLMCGLELLAFVVLATYVVVFLTLFVVTLGWRNAVLQGPKSEARHGLIALLFTLCAILGGYSAMPLVASLDQSYLSITSHLSAVGASQVSFAQVLQSLFIRLFIIELLLLNVFLLVGFQLISCTLSLSLPGSRRAITSNRVRRAWRRTPSSRHLT
jgi:hypothetical protein